jgi:hypothetical protein
MLQDNARPHTVESLRQLNLEALKHSPYCSGLAPSDCYLFGPLKDALRGRYFASDQEVKEVVHANLVTRPKHFYEGIQKSLWTGGLSVLKRKRNI